MRIRSIVVIAALLGACGGGDEAATGAPSVGATRGSAPPAAGETADSESPTGEILVQEVPYGATEDRNLVGYMAFPADAIDLPGVVMVHDRFGLDDSLRSFVDRLAGAGYVVLAVDFFGGATPGTGQEADALLASEMTDRELVLEHIEQAHAYLGEFMLAPRIGIIGWSAGGDWALEAGIALGDRIDAVVMYYGRPISDRSRLEQLQAPLLGNFADGDTTIRARDVLGFQGDLERLGKTAEIVLHRGVGHGFAAPGRDGYDADAAAAAWTATVDFLDDHLR